MSPILNLERCQDPPGPDLLPLHIPWSHSPCTNPVARNLVHLSDSCFLVRLLTMLQESGPSVGSSQWLSQSCPPTQFQCICGFLPTCLFPKMIVHMFWWGPDLWVILDGKELKNTRCDKIWEGSWRQDAFGCYFMCLSVNLSLSLRWKLLIIRTCLTPAFWFDFSRCSRSQDPLWGLLNGSHNPAHLLSFNAYVGSYWHVCFQKWSFICSDGGPISGSYWMEKN